jgi:hypothetical protein
VIGVGVDTDIVAAAKMSERPHGRHFDNLNVVAEPRAKRHLSVVGAAEAEDLRGLGFPLIG